MRLRRISTIAYRCILGAQVVLGFAVLLLGALPEPTSSAATKLNETVPVGLQLTKWSHGDGWWLLPFLVLASGIIGVYRSVTGPPWLWETIHSYLDYYRAEVFAVGADDAMHHHRVTLFRHKEWCLVWRRWPGSGWLIAEERSGHTTRSGISYFKAPDDADKAEGVAGKTWAKGGVVNLSHLPDLTASPAPSDFEAYSKATGVSVPWLMKKRPKARSFCGIPVEVKGAPWGVIVLDSRSPDGIPASSQVHFRPVGRILGKLLERV